MAGGMAWLALVLTASIGEVSFGQLFGIVGMPIGIVLAAIYLVLTVRGAGRLDVLGVAGATLLVVGAFWAEVTAIVADEGVMRLMSPGSSPASDIGVPGPMALSLIGALLFFAGMKLIHRGRGRAAGLWDAVAVAAICPCATLLTWLEMRAMSG